MRSAVIVSTARTPIGRAYRGAFNDTQSQALGGHVIAQAEGSFDAVGVFAGLTVLGLFVLLLDAGISVVEHRVIVWRPGREQLGG